MPSAVESPGASTLALMVTRRCNMACAHCSVESSSKIRQQPTEAELQAVITQAADAGVGAILFTGGEPMLREPIVLRLVSLATRCGLASAMTTNGFWGKTLPAARRTLADLKKAGLAFFTLSYDRYHAEFQGPEPARHILRAAEELKIPMNVNVTRVANDSDMASLLAPFEGSRHARTRFYDVQSVGRGRDLPPDSLRGETEGRCQAVQVPAITDDGRMTACNGPAYFQPASSPLAIGSLKETSLEALLRKHRDDPIFQTVKLFGPSRLRKELAVIPGFEKFPWRSSYSGLCDLCLHINSNPEACAALRERLSSDELVAERAARQLVIDGVRTRGETGREYSIGPGAARVWMSGARGAGVRKTAAWIKAAARTFGRADTDWRQMADYIAACGLSNQLLSVASDPAISKWAPSVFRERLEATAFRDARRELVQRRVLDTLDEELTRLGAKGVLLKGAAMLALEQSEAKYRVAPGRVPRRACGDIDIVVPAQAANALRQRLIAIGATGGVDDTRTAPHHLAPVILSGIPIEIHTRIMPSWWKLPESAMLRSTITCTKYRSLVSLDAEGMLLHSMMHCASHLFAYGLKTAWDAAWVVDRTVNIDYERLASWIRQTAMSAGFYLPARVMKSTLHIPLSAKLFATAPANPRYRVLERVIRKRLFIAMEGTSDLNPLTKHGFFLLLHNTWSGRMLHVTSLFRQHEREARSAKPYPESFISQLGESVSQLKVYRELALKTEAQATRGYEEMFNDSTESSSPVSAPA